MTTSLLGHWVWSGFFGGLLLFSNYYNQNFSTDDGTSFHGNNNGTRNVLRQIGTDLSGLGPALDAIGESIKNTVQSIASLFPPGSDQWKYHPDIDEMPKELSNIKSRLASLNNDAVSLERQTRELSSSISRSSIDDVWTGVISLQKQLLAMLRSIDDLLEHTPFDYAQHFQVLEDQVDHIAALLWGLMQNLGAKVESSVPKMGQIVSLVNQGKGQEAGDLLKNESDLKLIGGVVAKIYATGSESEFTKVLSLLENITKISGISYTAGYGYTIFVMGLIAHKQLYDNPLVFGLGREIWGDEMFLLPKTLKLILNTEPVGYCIRLPELSCCFYLASMFPHLAMDYKLSKMLSCLRKSEAKIDEGPAQLAQITFDDFGSASNNYRVKLHFNDEDRQAYGRAKDFLRNGDWKVTLARGNAYQARYIGPDGVNVGKWAGVCEQNPTSGYSSQPLRLPCFKDTPQNLYVAPFKQF